MKVTNDELLRKDFPISYFFNNFHFIKKIKETACRSAVSLKGEGIFYYGGSKKLYNVLGVFTGIIIANSHK